MTFTHAFARFKTFLAITLLASLGAGAYAGDLPIDWRSIRSAGMADAFTAIANDETAPFINPAGLGRVRNPRSKKQIHDINFPGLLIGGTSYAIDGLNKALTGGIELPTSVTDALNAPKAWFEDERFGRFISVGLKNPGDPLFLETQLYPAIIMGDKNKPTFLIGFPARSEFTLGVPNPADLSKTSILSRTTLGAALGVGITSPNGLVSVGFSLRPNYRYSYENEAYPTTGTSFTNFRKEVVNKAEKTYGLGADVGVLITVADYWLPTLGLALRNIPTGCAENYKNPITGKKQTVCGSLRVGTKNSQSRERLDPTEIRAGVSITPRFILGRGLKINSRFAADIWPIPLNIDGKNYGFYDINIDELIHAGMEFFFGNAFLDTGWGIRGGVHGKNFAFGLSARLGIVDIEYATFKGYSLIEGLFEKKQQRHAINMTAHF